MIFTVNAKLPSLNEYIRSINYNRHTGNRFKKEVQEVILWGIRQAQASGKLSPVDYPIILDFVWHERTKRRDPDNIASAKKFILDALQIAGILPNDNRKYVKGFTDTIVDDKQDFVVVQISRAD